MHLLNNIIIVIITLFSNVLLHICICQFISSKKFMQNGLLLGGVGAVILLILFLKQGTIDLIGIYLYFTMWLLYLMVFINLLNSVTLKMLERLYNEPTGFLYAADFKFIFNEEDGLKTRLEVMKRNEFIQNQFNSIMLTPKAQFLLKIIFILRKIFSIDHVG